MWERSTWVACKRSGPTDILHLLRPPSPPPTHRTWPPMRRTSWPMAWPRPTPLRPPRARPLPATPPWLPPAPPWSAPSSCLQGMGCATPPHRRSTRSAPPSWRGRLGCWRPAAASTRSSLTCCLPRRRGAARAGGWRRGRCGLGACRQLSLPACRRRPRLPPPCPMAPLLHPPTPKQAGRGRLSSSAGPGRRRQGLPPGRRGGGGGGPAGPHRLGRHPARGGAAA